VEIDPATIESTAVYYTHVHDIFEMKRPVVDYRG